MVSPVPPQHVVFATAGTSGDLHPFLGLALAVAARGVRTTVMVNAIHAPQVERAGLDCVALGTVDAFMAVVRDPGVWRNRRGFGLLWRGAREGLNEALAHLLALPADEATTLVAHPLALPHAAIARAHRPRLRVVAAYLAPSNLRTVHDPLTLGPLAVPTWLPHAARRALWRLIDARLIDPAALPSLDEDRRAHGLPPVAHFIEHLHASAQTSVALFPPWFGAARPDWPRPMVHGSFVLHDPGSAEALPEPVRAFLGAGAPPVVFTAGTGQVHAADLFAAALEATRRAGRRALLLTPERAQVPARLPADALWHGYVPLATLLPHVAAIVHHGGIGTVAEALRAGTPQLVVPWAYDQFDNGACVRALGAGHVSTFARRWPHRLVPALQALLADDAVRERCRVIAKGFEGEGEAARLRAVVDEILAPGGA
ncbi:MAG: glycosyltransferase [Burkholderiales bacterium]|nr:MAG: glycosyltransferase [Burkholderiales bacterium]